MNHNHIIHSKINIYYYDKGRNNARNRGNEAADREINTSSK